jgi:hypothetical protein
VETYSGAVQNGGAVEPACGLVAEPDRRGFAAQGVSRKNLQPLGDSCPPVRRTSFALHSHMCRFYDVSVIDPNCPWLDER